MENRRILERYKIKNVSDKDISFQITLSSGLVFTQVLEAGEVVEDVTYHGCQFLEPWVGSIEIRREDESFEGQPYITHDWLQEGF